MEENNGILEWTFVVPQGSVKLLLSYYDRKEEVISSQYRRILSANWEKYPGLIWSRVFVSSLYQGGNALIKRFEGPKGGAKFVIFPVRGEGQVPTREFVNSAESIRAELLPGQKSRFQSILVVNHRGVSITPEKVNLINSPLQEALRKAGLI